jgi:hypothetical protein
MLNPSSVMLNEVKDLDSRLRVNSVKHLDERLRINSAKHLGFIKLSVCC